MGRDPHALDGFVNIPPYRGSTVLFPTVAKLKALDQRFTYGRHGSPTVRGLEEAIAALEGGHRTILTASGLQAVTTAILSFVEAGDEILMVDSVYQPTRKFCDRALTRLGVKTIYYDPSLGRDIEKLMSPKTKLIFTESPGSQTFELQDIPALAKVAKAHNVWLLMDNTWATPLFCKPFDLGVDVSIQSATKYIVGHADALLGAITTTERATSLVDLTRDAYGISPGSEETYLGARGLRTIAVRLQQHQNSALEIARWLEHRPEVQSVLHPALETFPNHDIWKRDFSGSTGLFSIILKTSDENAIAAMLDDLQYFGMGYSWGGFESLIIPVDPTPYRTATQWPSQGQVLRLHIGLENTDDLKNDLAEGFGRLSTALS